MVANSLDRATDIQIKPLHSGCAEAAHVVMQLVCTTTAFFRQHALDRNGAEFIVSLSGVFALSVVFCQCFN